MYSFSFPKTKLLPEWNSDGIGQRIIRYRRGTKLGRTLKRKRIWAGEMKRKFETPVWKSRTQISSSRNQPLTLQSLLL
jgi:hypothetical protein